MTFEKRKVTTEDYRQQLKEIKRHVEFDLFNLLDEVEDKESLHKITNREVLFQFPDRKLFQYYLIDVWIQGGVFMCQFKAGNLMMDSFTEEVLELSLENKLILIDIINKSI